MQQYNEWLFAIRDDDPLEIEYDEAEKEFDTVLSYSKKN